jgi:hypothetical protein
MNTDGRGREGRRQQDGQDRQDGRREGRRSATIEWATHPRWRVGGFAVILALTLLVFKSSAVWVYYDGERRR